MSTATQEELERALTSSTEARMAGKIFDCLRSTSGRDALKQMQYDVPLREQIVQLGIPGISDKKLVLDKRVPLLEESFGDVATLAEASMEEIEESLRAVGIVARKVYDFLHNRGGEALLLALKEIGVDLTYKERGTKGEQLLAGTTVVITGTLVNYDRKGFEELVRDLGGKVTGSVSSKTTLVVYGAFPGSKLEKARSLGVETIDEQEFSKRIGR